MNVELLEAAQAELDHAYAWYERQRAGLGTQFWTNSMPPSEGLLLTLMLINRLEKALGAV